jgi:hypothetical protein
MGSQGRGGGKVPEKTSSGGWQVFYEMVLAALMGATEGQGRLTMSLGSARREGLPFPSARRKHPARGNPKGGQEIGLVLAFVVLLVWALFVVI